MHDVYVWSKQTNIRSHLEHLSETFKQEIVDARMHDVEVLSE